APKPVGAYPHARRVGSFLYLSGIGPRDPETDEVPGNQHDESGGVVKYDIEAQTRSVIRNLEQVLEEAGSSADRLVDVTVFLTDMKNDFPAFNRIWAEHFGENAPARTTVGVSSLPTPIAIEFKAVAEV
ncbi:MAG: Rid family hydrolase, partial [Thermoanaerobaculia bacterium]|nr:Rid family hydrolase [Thermoanaerobaculia bacterium]